MKKLILIVIAGTGISLTPMNRRRSNQRVQRQWKQRILTPTINQRLRVRRALARLLLKPLMKVKY